MRVAPTPPGDYNPPMRERIAEASAGFELYRVRRPEYHTADTVPFRVSPEPFFVDDGQDAELRRIGEDITAYLSACDGLWRNDGTVRSILSAGKPEIFLLDRPVEYLFVRPDLIVTPDGFTVTEVETSPFGLALADILTSAYAGVGKETLVHPGVLASYIRESTAPRGTVVYSDKTSAYTGQLSFLATKVFSGEGRSWTAGNVSGAGGGQDSAIYRGFYLHEYETDPAVRSLLDSLSSATTVTPSLTTHMEEKALLALLWDTRWEGYFRTILGGPTFRHLRTVIPPTWIVGEECYFSPGLPGGADSSIALASLSKSKRTFVLKSSGYSPDASWGEGVVFLHEQSRERAAHLLLHAERSRGALHVIQEFRRGKVFQLAYERNGERVPMAARVRLTPYYTFGAHPGDMIGIKATCCEGTDYIHATTSSINTAVATPAQ